jgi:hypothetical protein
MTREEAVEEMLFCSWHVPAQRDSMIADRVHSLYDEFEVILRAKDDEIKKLKEQYHQCLDDYIKCAERNN